MAEPYLAEEPSVEIAWLVEFPSSGDHYQHGKRVGPATPTQYYCAIPRRDNIVARTADPNDAMRFARRQDAEAMVAKLDSDSLFQVGVKTGGFASEHMWIGPPRSPAPTDRMREELAERFERIAISGYTPGSKQTVWVSPEEAAAILTALRDKGVGCGSHD